jgi:hypothetical protein
MLANYKKKTNIGVGLGILVQIAGYVLVHAAGMDPGVVPLFNLVGIILIIYGCVMYAKGKGYTGWLGLLGLLHLIGLIILAVMPDKHKKG